MTPLHYHAPHIKLYYIYSIDIYLYYIILYYYIIGMERRNFDETEDHAHYGPAPNPLMPDVVNIQTKLNTYRYDRERLNPGQKERNPAWNR